MSEAARQAARGAGSSPSCAVNCKSAVRNRAPRREPASSDAGPFALPGGRGAARVALDLQPADRHLPARVDKARAIAPRPIIDAVPARQAAMPLGDETIE